MNTGLTFLCGFALAVCVMAVIVNTTTIYGDAVISKKRIYPDITITIHEGKSDTTFVYKK